MPHTDYQKVREIGSGSFGRAYLVSCQAKETREKKLLVMKEIDMHRMDSRERKAAEVEVHVLSSLKHPYIVRYTESFVKDNVLCIVMDYCEGGDLSQYINQRKRHRSTIAEPQVLRWFTQMCLGLKHMHDKNILHRDIKTQNIFLAKRESKSEGSQISSVKIADFGIAKVLDSHTALAKTQVGTPYYLSPEIAQKQPYAMPSDVWALGCVLFELCALRVPFEAQDLPMLIDKIVRGTVPRIPNTYSRELSEIASELLSRRASDRPSAEKVLKRAMLQKEIQNMIDQNKKPGKGAENEGEEHGRARDREQGRARELPRAVLGERQPSQDRNGERRAPSKPSSRAASPSPHKEVAKQIIRPSHPPSRAPSPREHQNRPQSARRGEYIPHSARQNYQPQSAR